MPQDDSFWRDHLYGNAEHLKALNPDHYIDEGSRWRTLFYTTAGTAAGVLGIYAAYRRGHLAGLAGNIIKGMAQFRPAEADAIMGALRTWGREEQPWSKYDSLRDKLFAPDGLFRSGMRQARQNLADIVTKNRQDLDVRGITGGGTLINDELTIERVLREAAAAKREAQGYGSSTDSQVIRDRVNQFLTGFADADAEAQAMMMKQFGMRRATVRDVWDYGGSKGGLFNRHPSDARKRSALIRWGGRITGGKIWDKEVDPWVFYDPAAKKLHDLRYWPKTFKSVLNSMETDFAVPFVKFNPLAMFHIGDMLNVRMSPTIKLIAKTEVQPVLKANQPLNNFMLYLNGTVFDVSKKIELNDKFYFMSNKSGPGRIFMEGISGAGAPDMGEFTPLSGKFGGAWSWLTKKLDVGYQKVDPYNDAGYDVSNIMATPFTWFWKKFKPYQGQSPYAQSPFGYSFGVYGTKEAETPWLLMRAARWDNPVDIAKQIFASRSGIDSNVTSLTMPLYHFFSRLDASLATMGFGLHPKHRASGADIFLNMVMFRALPVYAAIEGWKYLNHESENILGVRPDEAIADAYSSISIGLAHGRDFLGVTDAAKQLKHLFPGGEQIADLPIFGGLVDLDDSAEETRRQLEEGEVAVRKGRWWPFGNTPFTGGRVQYFQPNWVRRTKSHYEYTDTQYGSESEYFANAPYPTPRYPLAPIRHFLTDPYHWEEKHYKDRPYLLTGGIPELEEFPLIGPLLSETIGEILKPTRRMHPEMWERLENKDLGYAEGMAKGAGFGIYGSPNDPMYSDQWYMKKTNIEGAWANVAGSDPRQVVVAVLDTGVDKEHPDLAGKLYPGINVSGGDESDWDDRAGHGTHVAGIIGAVGGNDQGVAGVAYPFVKILPIKVLGDSGIGSRENIMEGIRRAINWKGPDGEKVDIINMSLGMDAMTTDYFDVLKKAWDKGILTVAAAGNSGLSHVGTPAITPEAVAVGAVDRNFRRASFSNYGEGLDIAAPGTEMLSTIPTDSRVAKDLDDYDGYTFLQGTSMASPFVAAVAALLKAEQPDLTPAEIRYILQGTADDVAGPDWYPDYGWGVVDPDEATAVGANLDERERREAVKRGGEKVARQIAHERKILLDELSSGLFFKMAYAKTIFNEYGREIKDPTTAGMRMLQFWENVKEFGGFYGFATEFAYDTRKELEPQIATARAISSYRRSFWDTHIGGIPGELNEIARRFVGAREKWENRFNPLPNQMPHWLPGDDYFQDFKHGDPYVLVPKGEMRLPGHAYESIYETPEVEAALRIPEIRAALEAGLIKRGDLYGPITRFRILADIAPWSQEFKKQSKLVSSMNKSREEEEEIREIRAQVKERNQPLRIYPYRFKYDDTVTEEVTVTKVLDEWEDTHEYMFYTEEYPLNPIKLAGLHVPMGKDSPEGRAFLNQFIKPGVRVEIEYTADDLYKINDDTYKTIEAVVYSGRRNLNLNAIEANKVVEKEDDYSPAAVNARFSPLERLMGSLWERFAHMDNPYHTKLLQVRSGQEAYWRRDLYGKDWQEWVDPLGDFVAPTVQSMIAKPAILGLLGGALFGGLFGRNLFGSLMGAVAGGTIMGGGSILRWIADEISGDPWVPERRRTQWEINEYFDMLKYVKNMRLFEETADQATEEGFDVRRYLEDLEESDNALSLRISNLEEAKRKIKAQTEERPPKEWARELEIPEEGIETTRDLVRAINRTITELGNTRRRLKETRRHLPPTAREALDYLELADKTMYGYDPGEPYQNMLAAVPKRERQYIKYFLEAPAEEREMLKGRLSPYMERLIYPMWGEETPGKPSLLDYFTRHKLPEPEWRGWDPGVNIDDVKVKYINAESLDKSEFDVWPDDEARAARTDVMVPKINIQESAEAIKERLIKLLGPDAEITVDPDNSGRLTVEAEIMRDKRRAIAEYLNENGYLLFS